jgi:hypothetical protein
VTATTAAGVPSPALADAAERCNGSEILATVNFQFLFSSVFLSGNIRFAAEEFIRNFSAAAAQDFSRGPDCSGDQHIQPLARRLRNLVPRRHQSHF